MAVDQCGEGGRQQRRGAARRLDGSSVATGRQLPDARVRAQQAGELRWRPRPCAPRTGTATPARVRRWLIPTSLTPSQRHLARPEPGEADQRAPVRARHRRPVDLGPGDPERGERAGDVLAEPDHRRRDVVTDARVVQLRRRHDARRTTRSRPARAGPRRRRCGAGPPPRRPRRRRRRRARPRACVEPSTTAGRSTSNTQICGLAGSGNGRCVERRRRSALADDQPHRHEAQARYGFQASGTRATLTTTHADARGAWQGRARRIPASSGVRSRLARLHGRQAAATFSHTCSPPREPGQHVVDRLGLAPAVLAAVVVAGEHGPPRQRRPPAVRHLHHVAQADRRAGSAGRATASAARCRPPR